MSQASQTIATYVDLLKNTKLNAYTRDQLEYILYQLNLSMLKIEHSNVGSVELPCKQSELELLNRLIIATTEEDSPTAAKELGDRMSQIISRFHAVNDRLEIRHVCKERH
ncbi:hypothetical protein KI809_14510 [Geobacter pelophilus]|uniref:Uncharacterized protein n=1 Tax=Geoanaerobacter pelophilus TaxID=60036 RepID=A0AAW4L7I9_9BACT|nr:hypothetical protein [Geoanaerobacter pelophilus]MBT0665517.1 hypothetical protein [Geoanaerobacter pelophilus]